MAKQIWKAGNMVYPLPAVMVTCRDKDGNDDIDLKRVYVEGKLGGMDVMAGRWMPRKK